MTRASFRGRVLPWRPLLFGLWLAGCTAQPTQSAPATGVAVTAVRLELAPGVDAKEASYSIVGPDAFSRAGTLALDVPGNAFSALIAGLPPGKGYTISLKVSADGGVDCMGSAMFDVVAGQTTNVTLPVQCPAAPDSGGVHLDGRVCPLIRAVSAVPQRVSIGEAAALQVAVSDGDRDPAGLTYAWNVTRGVIDHADRMAASLACTEAGGAVATVTVTGGDGGCDAASATVAVLCVDTEQGGSGVAGQGAGGMAGSSGGMSVDDVDDRDAGVNESEGDHDAGTDESGDGEDGVNGQRDCLRHGPHSGWHDHAEAQLSGGLGRCQICMAQAARTHWFPCPWCDRWRCAAACTREDGGHAARPHHDGGGKPSREHQGSPRSR